MSATPTTPSTSAATRSGDEEMLARIAAAGRLRVDGHSPEVSGRALDAYIAAGVESDHEATRLAEAEEKRRKGM